MSIRPPLLTRGAFTTPTLSLFLVIVIAALTYLGVAAPTLLSEGRTATIQRAVTSVPQLSRWPAAVLPGLPLATGVSDPETGVWGRAIDAIDGKRQEQPEPLRSLLGAPRLTVTLAAQATIDPAAPAPINRVSLVSDPGFLARADLVDGRMPELTDPADGIEIAMTETVAQALEWQVGEQRIWDGTPLTLTGIVAPSGRDDADWAFVSGSADPIVEVGASGDRVLIGAGFMHVDEAAALVDRITAIKVASWMPFDTTAVDSTTAAKAAAQLRLLNADPVPIPLHESQFLVGGLQFDSGVPRAIASGLARGDAMTAVVTVAAVGPVAVALVVLALVSRLIAARRVVTARVLRARGGSVARLSAMLGAEGALLGLVGGAIGSVAAGITPGWTGAWALLVPVLLAVVPAVTMPWGALTDAEQHERRDLGEADSRGRGRLVLQLLVVAVTAVLVVLIMTRRADGGADPMLLAVPVLLGGTGSILALRLLPLLLSLAERRGSRQTSLASLLGPARARRDPVMRTAPVLSVVIGLGIAVFSVAFAATVTTGIARSAGIAVGADVRVDAPYIPDIAAQQVAELDGVARSAGLLGDSAVDTATGGQTVRTRVYAVDRDDFAAVQQGSATALPLPAALSEPSDDAVPVVASETLLQRLGLDPDPGGDPLEFKVSGTTVRVVATAPPQVPFGTAEQWVIVDTANAAALGQRSAAVSQLFLALEPGADADAVGAAAVSALGGGASFDTPQRAAAVYEEDPAFGIVQGALVVASVLIALLLAIAVVAILVLGAPSRARMLAILRTLGHPQRAAGRLVAWEVAPALLLALPFGAVAGIVIAWLVIPQLDLREFVGGSAQPPVVLGGVWPLVVVAGFALVVVAAVAAATVIASRLDSADAVRADDGREQ